MQLIPPQLANNEILVSVIFFFALISLIAWRRNGELAKEFSKLREVKQVRTFNKTTKSSAIVKGFLFLQYYIFFGLSLYLIFETEPAKTLQGLYEFDSDLLTVIALCVAVPCVWFLVHLILLHWFDYIFGTHNRLAIVDRIYLGYHLLYSPIIYVMFVMFVIADLPHVIIAILLFVFFIITQILLVYSIFRIFSNNKGSIYVILLYLCALEIAPLAVIYAKLGM